MAKRYTNSDLAKDFLEWHREEISYSGAHSIVGMNLIRASQAIRGCPEDLPGLYRRKQSLLTTKEKRLGGKYLSILEQIMAKRLRLPRKVHSKATCRRYLGCNYLIYRGEDKMGKSSGL